jgi:hypothetical protein
LIYLTAPSHTKQKKVAAAWRSHAQRTKITDDGLYDIGHRQSKALRSAGIKSGGTRPKLPPGVNIDIQSAVYRLNSHLHIFGLLFYCSEADNKRRRRQRRRRTLAEPHAPKVAAMDAS